MAWRKQPARHALAAKGISTGRFQRAQLDRVQLNNKVGGSFGKATSYDQVVNRLGKKYSEGDEIDPEDYERVIDPIFDALAEADILADRADFKNAIDKLDLAEHQFATLCGFYVRDADSAEFLAARKAICDKTIARSRSVTVTQQKVYDKVPDKAVVVVSQPQNADKPRVDERNSDSR